MKLLRLIKKSACLIYEWPLSARMHRIAEESLPLERLVVDLELAKEMFSDSIHKKKQLPSIAKNSTSGTVQEEFLNLLCIDNSIANISFYTLMWLAYQ